MRLKSPQNVFEERRLEGQQPWTSGRAGRRLSADPQDSAAAVGGHSSGSASDSGDQGRTAARTPIPTIGGPRGFGLRRYALRCYTEDLNK